ncbi:hypothetical protein DVA81_19185, partial [Acinetobacter baumannii]
LHFVFLTMMVEIPSSVWCVQMPAGSVGTISDCSNQIKSCLDREKKLKLCSLEAHADFQRFS